MTAGKSARDAAGNAARIEKWARRRASAFQAGADGEQVVAQELSALAARGWFLLHDRISPFGGNIDHIAVGPGGMIILDAKAWAGPVCLERGRLICAGRDAHKPIETALRLRDHMRQNLANIPVQAALVFVGTKGVDTLPAQHCGIALLPLERSVAAFEKLPASLSSRQVESALAQIAEMLPPADDRPALVKPEPVDPDNLETRVAGLVREQGVDQRYRFYLARDWAKAGKQRIFLNTPSGQRLGWLDKVSGNVGESVSPDVTALLQRLNNDKHVPTPDVSDLLSTNFIFRKVLGHLGSETLGTGHVVARVWRKSPRQRLYVTLHVIGELPRPIGWVDLTSGEMTITDPGRAGLVQHTWHLMFDDVMKSQDGN
jgi:hypothetical protein